MGDFRSDDFTYFNKKSVLSDKIILANLELGNKKKSRLFSDVLDDKRGD